MKRAIETAVYAQGNVYWRVPYVDVLQKSNEAWYESYTQLI